VITFFQAFCRALLAGLIIISTQQSFSLPEQIGVVFISIFCAWCGW